MKRTKSDSLAPHDLTEKNLELKIANLALVKTNKFLQEFQERVSRQGVIDKAGLAEVIRKEIEKNIELRYLIKEAARQATITKASKLEMRQSIDLLHVAKNLLSADLKQEKAKSRKLKSQLETAAMGTISAAELKQKDFEIDQLNKEIITIAKISSHDLQEPLRNIQVFIGLLLEKEEHNLSSQGKEYFSRMQKSAARVRQLIQDLSEYSHLNKALYRVERTDLNKVLKEAMKELEVALRKSHAQITAVRLPSVVVAPLHFRKIFKELLCNATKFSRPRIRPKIKVGLELMNGSELKELRLNPRKKYYKISFTDNGIGFNPHYKERIFEVFQKLGAKDQPGSGIGLASCKKIIENYNGRITADSRPGKGSTFNIYIAA